MIQPRTQKGIGLSVLKGLFPFNVQEPCRIIQCLDDIGTFSSDFFPVFARPAPSRPRHGYIDSRIVSSSEELTTLLQQVFDDDPHGEILLCPYIRASHSAIWTPGSLVIGRGNDGATAGKNVQIVPLVGKNTLPKYSLRDARIDEEMWPYIEVVYPSDGKSSQDQKAIFVQLREGPKMSVVQGNYIPKTTLVTKIIRADPRKFRGTTWETVMKDAKSDHGTVIWHPRGAMTDHFSIHAFTAKIPIIFDARAPIIGSVIEPDHETAGFDPQAMLKGIVIGEKIYLKQEEYKSYLKVALVSLHNSPSMTGEASKWIGIGAALLARFSATALKGEVRHFHHNGPNSTIKERDAVYQEVINKSLSYHHSRINALINIFRYGVWQSPGFGGIKWASCGAATVDLFNAIGALALDHDEESASRVVQAMNIVVNQAHNGGWWLNKFASTQYFRQASKGDILLVTDTAPCFYHAGCLYDTLLPEILKRSISGLRRWHRLALSPPRVSSAQVTFRPEVNSLDLSVSSRLLRGRCKRFKISTVNMPKNHMKLLDKFLYLVEGEDGYQLELRKKDPVVIWRDPSLREMMISAGNKYKKENG